jgi:hypothetical protein
MSKEQRITRWGRDMRHGESLMLRDGDGLPILVTFWNRKTKISLQLPESVKITVIKRMEEENPWETIETK